MHDTRPVRRRRVGVPLRAALSVLGVLLLTGPAAGGGPTGPAPPDLYPAYQINLELIDLLGGFFHRDSSFPEVRELTDVAAVKLAWWLEDPDQTRTDFNLFVLDARIGSIVYSVGLHGLGAYRDPGLVGASALAVLPTGRIGVLDAAGRLDPCFAFDGSTVDRVPGCTPLASTAHALSPHGQDRFLVLTAEGELVAVEAPSGERTRILLASHRLESPTAVVSDGATLAVVDRGGHRLALFRATGQGGSAGRSGMEVFRPVARAESLRVPLEDGTTSDPVEIADVAVNRDGFVHLLVQPEDCLLTLDVSLEPRAYAVFPPMPIPFRRLEGATGLALVPESGLLHVVSPQALSAYSESPGPREIVLRHTPPELVPVLHAIDSIPIETFDPTGDLFDHPHVRPVLEAAFEALTAALKRR